MGERGYRCERERERRGRETGVREKERDRGGREKDRTRDRGGRERERKKIKISTCKNKEYKKAKSFIWMF